MSIFDPVEFTWKEKQISIPANRVMRLIGQVEEVITLKELADMQAAGRVNLSRVSAAYAAVIRFAGEQVTDEQIYESLFSVNGQRDAMIAVQSLLLMMVPKSVKEKTGSKTEGNVPPVATENVTNS